MTRAEFKAAIQEGVVLPETGELTSEQKNTAIDKIVSNLNKDTVNPDKETRPVVFGLFWGMVGTETKHLQHHNCYLFLPGYL